jgi:hypothetical protein
MTLGVYNDNCTLFFNENQCLLLNLKLFKKTNFSLINFPLIQLAD